MLIFKLIKYDIISIRKNIYSHVQTKHIELLIPFIPLMNNVGKLTKKKEFKIYLIR